MNSGRVYTRLAAAAAAAGWLAIGCVRFESQPLSPARTAAGFEARTLDAPELRPFLEKHLQRRIETWPLPAWDFDMLTLVAFYYHPSLELARARWEVAQAGELTAGARPNPTLSVAPQYTANAARGVSPWLAAIDVDVPIETAGKRGYRLARARQESEAARLRIATAAWQVRSSLRAALIDYGSAGPHQDLMGQQIAVLEKALRRMEQKVTAGALAEFELAPLRIALQKSRIALANAAREQLDARGRAANALGVPARALASVALPALPTNFAGLTRQVAAPEARGVALNHRADLRAALADYAACQAALQLEIAKQYPDVHLGPGYEYDQGENRWGLKLSLELPLLNRNAGPIAEAQARRAEAAARFIARQTQVLGELDQALVTCQAMEQQLGALEILLAAQRKQQRHLEAQVNAGALEPLDLLNAQIERSLGELARHDAQLKMLQAIGQLEDALQLPVDFIDTLLAEQTPKPAKP